MSLPPEQRVRRGRGKPKQVGGTPPAQLDHASSPKARRHQRDGERKMDADRAPARTRPARSASVEIPGDDEEIMMSTDHDVAGLVPQIQPCPECGQALPQHLTVCPSLGSPAVTPATLDAVEEQEKHLGEAI